MISTVNVHVLYKQIFHVQYTIHVHIVMDIHVYTVHVYEGILKYKAGHFPYTMIT